MDTNIIERHKSMYKVKSQLMECECDNYKNGNEEKTKH